MVDVQILASALDGATLGLIAGISPGPLLALVVSLSLAYGAREGIKASFAPVCTDGPILAVSLWAVGSLAGNQVILGAISLAGAVVLAVQAVASLRFVPASGPGEGKPPASLLRAVATNYLSPHPYLFWASIGAPLTLAAYERGFANAAAFVLGFFAAICGSKAAVAVLAARSAGLLGSRGYARAIKITGLGLAYYALVLLGEALSRFGLV